MSASGRPEPAEVPAQARLIGLELGVGLVLALLAGILFAWVG